MDITLVGGVPVDAQNQITARIYMPSKNPMQSGTNNTKHWVVSFEGVKRWENPNMGWCSTGNPVSNVHLNFLTKEDAIAFCKKTGWSWIVLPSATTKKIKVRSYAKNFHYNKRFRVSTK
nr:unnamed protein product [Callosobruchus analis]